MKKTAKEWVKHANCSVCVVDWRKLSGENAFEYVKVATRNTVLTRNSIHRFMEFLSKNGMDITKVSIAGHR